MPLTFDVLGCPAPQSGTRSVPTKAGNRQISTGGVGLKDWRAQVASAARQAAAGATISTAVAVDVTFRFMPPKARLRAAILAGSIPKTTKPDLDKLIRACGDSLVSGGLLADDNLITELSARKIETVGWTGATITITTL